MWWARWQNCCGTGRLSLLRRIRIELENKFIENKWHLTDSEQGCCYEHQLLEIHFLHIIHTRFRLSNRFTTSAENKFGVIPSRASCCIIARQAMLERAALVHIPRDLIWLHRTKSCSWHESSSWCRRWDTWSCREGEFPFITSILSGQLTTMLDSKLQSLSSTSEFPHRSHNHLCSECNRRNSILVDLPPRTICASPAAAAAATIAAAIMRRRIMLRKPPPG